MESVQAKSSQCDDETTDQNGNQRPFRNKFTFRAQQSTAIEMLLLTVTLFARQFVGQVVRCLATLITATGRLAPALMLNQQPQPWTVDDERASGLPDQSLGKMCVIRAE